MIFSHGIRTKDTTYSIQISFIQWLRIKIGWFVWQNIERPALDQITRKAERMGILKTTSQMIEEYKSRAERACEIAWEKNR